MILFILAFGSHVLASESCGKIWSVSGSSVQSCVRGQKQNFGVRPYYSYFPEKTFTWRVASGDELLVSFWQDGHFQRIIVFHPDSGALPARYEQRMRYDFSSFEIIYATVVEEKLLIRMRSTPSDFPKTQGVVETQVSCKFAWLSSTGSRYLDCSDQGRGG